MEALRKTHQRSKKNPYAERGLDKFALLSAELQEKREKLVAQLGSPSSLVRFEVGPSHHDWVPIVACPTSASSEIAIAKGTATVGLIAEDKPAIISYGNASFSAAASRRKDSDIPASNVASKEKMILAQDVADHQPPHLSDRDGEDAQRCHQRSPWSSCLLAVLERFLWMAGFIFSVSIDIVCSVLASKWDDGDAGSSSAGRLVRSYSSWRPKETIDHPPASKPSSTQPPSLHTPPASISAADGNTDMAHGEDHRVRNRRKSQGLLTAPASTNGNSKQGKKSLQETVSFPTVMRNLQDEVPCSGISSKNSKFLKSVSLPNASTQAHGFFRLQAMLRGPSSATRETAELKKVTSLNLGQALTGAGLALCLGGLVIGFIPAIACIVCWWYGLPSMRRAAVGSDKPPSEKSPSPTKVRASSAQ